MSDSPAHRPMYVYGLGVLAFALFLTHAVNAFADDPVEVLTADESTAVEVIVVSRSSVSELSRLHEDHARVRVDAGQLQFLFQVDREPALPGRITIPRP